MVDALISIRTVNATMYGDPGTTLASQPVRAAMPLVCATTHSISDAPLAKVPDQLTRGNPKFSSTYVIIIGGIINLMPEKGVYPILPSALTEFTGADSPR